MPGPNDSHIDKNGRLQPGLGRDELTPEQRAAMNSRSGQALVKMKEELAAIGAEMEVKEKQLTVKEQAIMAAQREIESQKQAMAEAEAKLREREAAINAQALAAARGDAGVDGDEDETDGEDGG